MVHGNVSTSWEVLGMSYILTWDARIVHHLGAIWFWPEKTRTAHHLGSSMILTVEGTYCPSSGKLCDFDMRRHVLPIILGAMWFWPENSCTVHHLGSYMILTWEHTYCPSSGELYDFDSRGHVPSIIWRAIWFQNITQKPIDPRLRVKSIGAWSAVGYWRRKVC